MIIIIITLVILSFVKIHYVLYSPVGGVDTVLGQVPIHLLEEG